MDRDFMKTKVMNTFLKVFGDSAGVRTFFAPGRVNLIGEHTDYNGGHVLPCALTIGTYAAVRKRQDTLCNFYSINFEELGVISRDINETKFDEDKSFSNYPLGVVKMLKDAGYLIDKGFDVVYYGDIPNSSGLSSSASIEVLTGYFLSILFDLNITKTEIALICQKCENEFIGVNCGIMDQFIIANGKKDNAIYLDTNTLEFSYIPVLLDGYKLVITSSNKKRGLKDSKYNERRAECEEALKAINKVKPVASLGELSESEFGEFSNYINDDILTRRARHAVYENQRTIKACHALKGNDIETFGSLMNESHISLRDDYEVTGLELDTLVSSAWEQKGVIGSRMTGAGFGGCTVSIVRDEFINEFIEAVSKEYSEKIGLKADFYVVEIGDGPSELK